MIFGDAGHRSPYLSHAKRALYHLSHTPDTFVESGIDNISEPEHLICSHFICVDVMVHKIQD